MDEFDFSTGSSTTIESFRGFVGAYRLALHYLQTLDGDLRARPNQGRLSLWTDRALGRQTLSVKRALDRVDAHITASQKGESIGASGSVVHATTEELRVAYDVLSALAAAQEAEHLDARALREKYLSIVTRARKAALDAAADIMASGDNPQKFVTDAGLWQEVIADPRATLVMVQREMLDLPIVIGMENDVATLVASDPTVGPQSPEDREREVVLDAQQRYRPSPVDGRHPARRLDDWSEAIALIQEIHMPLAGAAQATREREPGAAVTRVLDELDKGIDRARLGLAKPPASTAQVESARVIVEAVRAREPEGSGGIGSLKLADAGILSAHRLALQAVEQAALDVMLFDRERAESLLGSSVVEAVYARRTGASLQPRDVADAARTVTGIVVALAAGSPRLLSSFSAGALSIPDSASHIRTLRQDAAMSRRVFAQQVVMETQSTTPEAPQVPALTDQAGVDTSNTPSGASSRPGQHDPEDPEDPPAPGSVPTDSKPPGSPQTPSPGSAAPDVPKVREQGAPPPTSDTATPGQSAGGVEQPGANDAGSGPRGSRVEGLTTPRRGVTVPVGSDSRPQPSARHDPTARPTSQPAARPETRPETRRAARPDTKTPDVPAPGTTTSAEPPAPQPTSPPAARPARRRDRHGGVAGASRTRPTARPPASSAAPGGSQPAHAGRASVADAEPKRLPGRVEQSAQVDEAGEYGDVPGRPRAPSAEEAAPPASTGRSLSPLSPARPTPKN
jgi:hypothetical protein